MNRLALISILATAIAATGCGVGGGDDDDEVVTCSFSGPASATVGGGSQQVGFVNMSPGDDMVVVLGPQGLYMVTPSVRIQEMYPGKAGRTGHPNDPEILVELYMGGTLIGGSARENIGLRVTADGGEALGIFAPFTATLNDYLGQTVTVRAEVEDACGRSASGDLDIVAVQ